MAEPGAPRPRGSSPEGSRPGGSARRRRRGGRGRSGQGQGQRQSAGSGSGAAGARKSRSPSSGRTSARRTPTSAPQRAARRPEVARPTVVTSVSQSSASPLVEDQEIRANRRRALIIALLGAFIPALVPGIVVALVVSPLGGVIAGGAVLLVLAAAIPRLATRMAIRVIGARPLGEDELPRLQNLVDGLCPTFGVRRPSLMAIDDDLPNACSVGSGPDHGVLVVTTGLDRRLDLIEMEGVVAHEFSHLKRSDVVVSSMAVAVLAPFIWLTGNDALLHRVVGFGREQAADQVAVRAVRYPPGLSGALGKFVTGGPPLAGSLFARRRIAMSRWLWIDPAVGRRDQEVTGDLDLTTVRIEVLAEL